MGLLKAVRICEGRGGKGGLRLATSWTQVIAPQYISKQPIIQSPNILKDFNNKLCTITINDGKRETGMEGGVPGIGKKTEEAPRISNSGELELFLRI